MRNVNAFWAVCTWLDSALKCENFRWDADQHAAATECLQDAKEMMDEAVSLAVHIPRGFNPDDDQPRFTRSNVMNMMAVIRCLEAREKNRKSDSLTCAHPSGHRRYDKDGQAFCEICNFRLGIDYKAERDRAYAALGWCTGCDSPLEKCSAGWVDQKKCCPDCTHAK